MHTLLSSPDNLNLIQFGVQSQQFDACLGVGRQVRKDNKSEKVLSRRL
jgi:hypothetical protein